MRWICIASLMGLYVWGSGCSSEGAPTSPGAVSEDGGADASSSDGGPADVPEADESEGEDSGPDVPEDVPPEPEDVPPEPEDVPPEPDVVDDGCQPGVECALEGGGVGVCIDDGALGVCREVCDAYPEDTCGAGQRCAVKAGQSSGFCAPETCGGMLGPDDCGPGAECLIWGEPYCFATTADVAEGAPCGSFNDCGEDQVCLVPPLGCTTAECDTTGNAPPCPEGTGCWIWGGFGLDLEVGNCQPTCTPFADECEAGSYCFVQEADAASGELSGLCLTLGVGELGPGAPCGASLPPPGEGEPQAQCAAGLVCGQLGSQQAQCRPRCLPGAAEGEAGSCEVGSCVPLEGDDFYGFCWAACDPFAESSGCEKGEACWPDPLAPGLGTCYGPNIEKTVGDVCGYTSDCSPGEVCTLSVSGLPTCHLACDTGAPDGGGCGEGRICRGVYNGNWLGVCVEPCEAVGELEVDCPEGQWCAPNLAMSGVAECVHLEDEAPAGLGEACGGEGGLCDVGLVCVDEQCATACDVDATSCGEGEICRAAYLDSVVGYCSPGCVPFTEGACPEGEGCVPDFGQAGVGTCVVLETAGQVDIGGACEPQADDPNVSCAPGGGCMNFPGGNTPTTCWQHCAVGAGEGEPGACPAGLACLPFGNAANLPLGACATPCDASGGGSECGEGRYCFPEKWAPGPLDADWCGDIDQAFEAWPLAPGDPCPPGLNWAFCAPDHVCRNHLAGVPTCTPLCDVDSDAEFGEPHDSCSGALCTDVGLPGVGVCASVP